ncbi:TPA: ParA family protein [Pseudomonas putida]
MSLISPSDLKNLRRSLRLTCEQAAISIDIKARAWRSYETSADCKSHRTIPERSLRVFCERHGVPYPPTSNDGRLLSVGCKIISITAYKGGVGKSPITVDVATELARRGSRVAIITGDVVYRCSMGDEMREHRRLKIKNSPVTYFDESDVTLYSAELRDLERKLEEDLAGTGVLDPGEIRFCYGYQIERIKRKKVASHALSTLVKEYDYILLDLNRDMYRTLLLSNVIALVLDNRCLSSIWSAEQYCEDIIAMNGGRPVSHLYTLITNHAPCGDGTEYLEYIDDEADAEQVRREVIESYEHQSEVYLEARKLRVPMLRTFMTKAHSMEIARYNSTRGFWDGYCYFDSVVDFAPDSLASDEIRRLTDELIDCVTREYHGMVYLPRSA